MAGPGGGGREQFNQCQRNPSKMLKKRGTVPLCMMLISLPHKPLLFLTPRHFCVMPEEGLLWQQGSSTVTMIHFPIPSIVQYKGRIVHETPIYRFYPYRWRSGSVSDYEILFKTHMNNIPSPQEYMYETSATVSCSYLTRLGTSESVPSRHSLPLCFYPLRPVPGELVYYQIPETQMSPNSL